MQHPNGPADIPKYNSFCVAHVLVGGNRPGCKIVHHKGYDTPNDPEARRVINNRYAGSMLQAATCRAIAAKLMWANRTGLTSPVLQSQASLNDTVHNNLESK
jgi:hypothetical protein